MLDKCVALVTNQFRVVHLVIFVEKGKRGEEGPRGKQGARVSELYSVISFTTTIYTHRPLY